MSCHVDDVVFLFSFYSVLVCMDSMIDVLCFDCRTSLEDPNAPVFSRDQFGRQSMSEKRHAALDAKNTDTYQRNKKIR